MRAIIRVIDSITEWTGKTIRWLCAVLVVLITYEVVIRQIVGGSTLWAFETSIMIGITVYAFAFSYALKHGAHVRVDVIYSHLSPRVKAIIDVLGDLFLFFPLVALLVYSSFGYTWYAWKEHEIMLLSSWFPPAAPWRTLFMIALTLFLLQGVAQLIRDFHVLIRNRPYD